MEPWLNVILAMLIEWRGRWLFKLWWALKLEEFWGIFKFVLYPLPTYATTWPLQPRPSGIAYFLHRRHYGTRVGQENIRDQWSNLSTTLGAEEVNEIPQEILHIPNDKPSALRPQSAPNVLICHWRFDVPTCPANGQENFCWGPSWIRHLPIKWNEG